MRNYTMQSHIVQGVTACKAGTNTIARINCFKTAQCFTTLLPWQACNAHLAPQDSRPSFTNPSPIPSQSISDKQRHSTPRRQHNTTTCKMMPAFDAAFRGGGCRISHRPASCCCGVYIDCIQCFDVGGGKCGGPARGAQSYTLPPLSLPPPPAACPLHDMLKAACCCTTCALHWRA